MKAGTKPYFNNVLKKLINIKKYTTKEELDKLNINTLSPLQGGNCIYGQMATNCYSFRAIELIKLCCQIETCFKEIDGADSLESINDIARKNDYANFTYLENCIVKFSHNNNNIIKFLKSEIDIITLTSNNMYFVSNKLKLSTLAIIDILKQNGYTINNYNSNIIIAKSTNIYVVPILVIREELKKTSTIYNKYLNGEEYHYIGFDKEEFINKLILHRGIQYLVKSCDDLKQLIKINIKQIEN